MACDPGETILRELAEETGLNLGRATELLNLPDEHGYSQTTTFSAAARDSDESTLPVTEEAGPDTQQLHVAPFGGPGR
ncbi:NUDIX domain-containing protein [Kitasatospora sp. NPDC005751]|uniref:NUDIX domain-containing protein n=1 Tax=Kitasatospora sp. NPDC005751 TaxID=3157064 RepID=UPI0034031152